MTSKLTLPFGAPACFALLTLVVFGTCAAVSVGAQVPDPTDARHRMVEEQIVDPPMFSTPVRDERVLTAMRAVPRHEFVPASLRAQAYEPHPLPIGHGQTISQPYIVARMTELLELEPGDRVLEIGTGSGYQAAVLAEITEPVYTIEIISELARTARERLERLGYGTVTVRHGDGYGGWPEQAPFDAIIVTAAPEEVPQPLIDQLAPGGRMVVPTGPRGDTQVLLRLRRTPEGDVTREEVTLVRFVPMLRDTVRTDPSGAW